VKLISAGYLTNGDRDSRLSTDGSALIIADANAANDSGLYTCTTSGGLGPNHRINLTVLGKLSGQFFCRMTNYELFLYHVSSSSNIGILAHFALSDPSGSPRARL